MEDLATTLPPLVGSLLLLLLLAWFRRQISLHTQLPFYKLTRSQNSATLAIFLFFCQVSLSTKPHIGPWHAYWVLRQANFASGPSAKANTSVWVASASKPRPHP